MLTDVATWQRLVDMGIKEWIAEKQASGEIRRIGFSYHGGTDMFCRLVDAYDWDFTQIQYNYMDEHSQAGRRGLHYAHEKGLSVIIMEPLRGGRLVRNLPAEVERLFDSCKIKRTPADWALRWLWDQKEVTVVLSGMNSMATVKENMATASNVRVGELSSEEKDLLSRVVKAINSKSRVGCTGCGYCTPCPKGVDIPGIFAAYNRLGSDGKFCSLKEYFMCTTLRTNSAAASECVGCGKCEKHCPQGLPIRKHLAEAKDALEGPVYRVARRIVKKIAKF